MSGKNKEFHHFPDNSLVEKSLNRSTVRPKSVSKVGHFNDNRKQNSYIRKILMINHFLKDIVLFDEEQGEKLDLDQVNDYIQNTRSDTKHSFNNMYMDIDKKFKYQPKLHKIDDVNESNEMSQALESFRNDRLTKVQSFKSSRSKENLNDMRFKRESSDLDHSSFIKEKVKNINNILEQSFHEGNLQFLNHHKNRLE